jgi:hypothetical protein
VGRCARTGNQTLVFNVLGAYGYPAVGEGRARVWALRAYHRATAVEWQDFLRHLDTAAAPRLVSTDGADEIANAVRAVWLVKPGPPFPIPFVFRCEHRLHQNGAEAMEGDDIGGGAHYMRRRLDAAFRPEEGWQELQERAAGYAYTTRWLSGIRRRGHRAGRRPTRTAGALLDRRPRHQARNRSRLP